MRHMAGGSPRKEALGTPAENERVAMQLQQQTKERAFDLLVDERSQGDHGFTHGALRAWKAQRSAYLNVFRAIFTGASTEFIVRVAEKAYRSECPVSFATRVGRNEPGTKGGRMWMGDVSYTVRQAIRELRGW